jgi:hypothetical protein
MALWWCSKLNVPRRSMETTPNDNRSHGSGSENMQKTTGIVYDDPFANECKTSQLSWSLHDVIRLDIHFTVRKRPGFCPEKIENVTDSWSVVQRQIVWSSRNRAVVSGKILRLILEEILLSVWMSECERLFKMIMERKLDDIHYRNVFHWAHDTSKAIYHATGLSESGREMQTWGTATRPNNKWRILWNNIWDSDARKTQRKVIVLSYLFVFSIPFISRWKLASFFILHYSDHIRSSIIWLQKGKNRFLESRFLIITVNIGIPGTAPFLPSKAVRVVCFFAVAMALLPLSHSSSNFG